MAGAAVLTGFVAAAAAPHVVSEGFKGGTSQVGPPTPTPQVGPPTPASHLRGEDAGKAELQVGEHVGAQLALLGVSVGRAGIIILAEL